MGGLFPAGCSSAQQLRADGNSLTGFALLSGRSLTQQRLLARAPEATKWVVIVLLPLVLYLKGAADEEQGLAEVYFLLL